MQQMSDDQIRQAASVSPLKFLPPNLRATRKGRNGWMAQCPFHNDRTPSMSITQCDDGRYRWKCHGCDEAGDTITLIQKTREMSFVDAVKLAINAAQTAPLKPQIEAVYDYFDEQGELLYQIVRYSPKAFKCRTLLPNGEYCWRKPPRTVLYRLSGCILHSQEPIYVVEGEKDADAIVRAGGVATTWPFGATAWKDEYARFLQAWNVVIVPDMDEAGKAAGRRVYESVKPWAARMGHVLLSVGKDASDYFAAGKTLEDLKGEITWDD